MEAVKAHAVVAPDGSVTVTGLPFGEGQSVEVIVLDSARTNADEKPSPFGAMRGSVLRYDDPFEPAADPSDWEALK